MKLWLFLKLTNVHKRLVLTPTQLYSELYSLVVIFETNWENFQGWVLHGQGHSQLLSVRFRNCLSTGNGTLGGPVVSAFIFMTIRNNAFQPELSTIYAAFLHSRQYMNFSHAAFLRSQCRLMICYCTKPRRPELST